MPNLEIATATPMNSTPIIVRQVMLMVILNIRNAPLLKVRDALINHGASARFDDFEPVGMLA